VTFISEAAAALGDSIFEKFVKTPLTLGYSLVLPANTCYD
jgi:hypothetical protein